MSSDHRTPYLFVSYASADRERVLALVARLEAVGVDIWIDRDGIHGGANYAQVISDAIKGAAALLLAASPAALASRNVRQELALGWRYEKPYLPLLLDPVEIPDELAYWLEGSQW
ncbi:MAG TPA: toll/interleukin-1 receptor domain-containing protein, partial [Nitrolancea sp.]|nr:toll/interleukin-1 receptor domain-containing protein [Nitrolancea sp.]